MMLASKQKQMHVWFVSHLLCQSQHPLHPRWPHDLQRGAGFSEGGRRPPPPKEAAERENKSWSTHEISRNLGRGNTGGRISFVDNNIHHNYRMWRKATTALNCPKDYLDYLFLSSLKWEKKQEKIGKKWDFSILLFQLPISISED